MKFELKSVSGKSILFVMAAEAEYGPFLRSRIEPLMTGVGPAEAAQLDAISGIVNISGRWRDLRFMERFGSDRRAIAKATTIPGATSWADGSAC